MATNGTTAAAAARSARAKRGEATKRRETARRRSASAQRAARAAATQRVDAEAKGADALATQVAGVAESAVLIPVGAALETRDRVVDAIRPWTNRASAERELNRVRRTTRRFERRGTVARNRTVREIKQRRNRVSRELRKRRTQVTRVVRGRRSQVNRAVKQNRRRADHLRNGVEKAVKPQVDRVQQLV